MASNVVPQASQTLSCPLLKLPPELRLLIYTHTQRLDLDIELNDNDGEKLSIVWASTPLVKLAATCHLIAREARDHVRSMPNSQREALVDLSGARGPDRHMITRLRQLPCPTGDLRYVVVAYNFEKHKSTAYGFPADHHDLEAVHDAMVDIGYFLFAALCRLMADAAIDEATHFWLQINGLRLRKDEESYCGAVPRVLWQPTTDPVSAERLVQEFYSWVNDDALPIKDASNPQLADGEGIPLYLFF
ncbi:hypothetical protein Q7P35_010895 [Cladosporium inversicolor]